MMLSDFVFSSVQHKVLKFLCENIGKDFYDAEIARMIPLVSKAAVNNALRTLYQMGLSKRYFIGNLALNRVESTCFFIREYRKLIYAVELNDFFEETQPWIHYAAIFGEYIDKPLSHEKTADIFIVSEKPERITKIFKQYKYAKFLNLISYDQKEFEWFKNDSPSVWADVQKGLILIH